MQPITITTKLGDIVVSPLTTRQSAQKTNVFRHFPGDISESDSDWLTWVILFSFHIVDFSGFDEGVKNALIGVKQATSSEELMASAELYDKAMGFNNALHNQLISAVTQIARPNADEADDAKKSE